MGNLYVARRTQRTGLFLPMKKQSDLMFFLPKVDRSELDEIIRANLAKVGITDESQVQGIVDKAEVEYERRIKVAEAEREVRRLMELKANGAKLMQKGNKKWVETFYPAVRKA